LAARFHPVLTAHYADLLPTHGQRALAASNHYAEHLAALAVPRIFTGARSLELVQALLMLGFHKWGTCHGETAWMYVGGAIRMAQLMGLEREDAVDSPAHSKPASRKLGSADHIEKEIRRRTLFSCFVLDRYLSCGINRHDSIDVRDLKIRLPCSEHDFLFGRKSRMGFMCDSLPGMSLKNHMDDEDDEPALSKFIRLVEIWGRFSKWSCAGGRR
jgi:hypothetical protein